MSQNARRRMIACGAASAGAPTRHLFAQTWSARPLMYSIILRWNQAIGADIYLRAVLNLFPF